MLVKGYLKFTGPNVLEVDREADKTGLPPVPFNWWECAHNDVDCARPVTVISRKPGKAPREVIRHRHIPHFVCNDGERVYRMRKRCERVFVELRKSAKEYEVPQEAIFRYEFVLEKYRENWERHDTPEVFRTRLPGNGRTLSEGDLIYFRLDEKGEKVKDIIPVCISRIVDEEPLIYRLREEFWPCVLTECPRKGFECKECLLEALPEKLIFRVHKEGLCPACSLFGTAIYRGRVRCSFAWAEEAEFAKEKITLPRLEAPRASWMFRRDAKEEVPGRKFYLHSKKAYAHSLARSHAQQIPKTENNATFEVLTKGRFVFQVWFENLRDWELGLLLITLAGLGDAVKLGHARANGFGRVRSRLKAFQLYEKEKATFQPIEDATQYVNLGLKKLKEWFDEKKLQEHLKRLRNLLTFQEGLEVEYPEEGYEYYEAIKERLKDKRELFYELIEVK